MEQIVTFLHKLANSWISDFQLVIPKNLKLFLLVTLNAVKQTYAILVRKWWWLYGGLIAMNLVGIINIIVTYDSPYLYVPSNILMILQFIVLILQFIPLFILFLTVRPSVSIKNYSYYGGYYKHYFFSYAILMGLVFAQFIPFLRGSLLISKTFILSPFVSFFMFFYLDSDGSIREVFLSIYRAFKMLFFHVPLIIVMLVIFSYAFSGSIYVFNQNLHKLFEAELSIKEESFHLIILLRDLAYLVASYLLLPFIICFYNNFYIKKVHEQFNLYFPNNS